MIRRSQFVEALLMLLLLKLMMAVCSIIKTLGEDRDLGLERKLVVTV